MSVNFNTDAMDLDEPPLVMGDHPLFFVSLISQPEEESIETLQEDPQLYTLFQRAIGQQHPVESIAQRLANIAVRLLPEGELPRWVGQFSLQPELISLVEAVRRGHKETLERTLTAAQWLSHRDAVGSSLLHVAIQEGHEELAIKLVERCPQFLLATNSQERFALDLLPLDPNRIEFVERLTMAYGQAGDPEIAIWRQLAPLCYIENFFWLDTFIQKHGERLKELDPRHISQEPIHYHPLKICARLEKKESATRILEACCSHGKMAWACVAGAGALVGFLPEDRYFGFQIGRQIPPYLTEHPAASKLMFPLSLTSLRHFTTAILLHQGLSDLALKRIRGPLEALEIAPDSPHTEELWIKEFAGNPKKEIEEITHFLEINSHRIPSISPSGLSFLIKKLKGVLNEKNALVSPRSIVHLVLMSQDRDLAQQCIVAFKGRPNFDWLPLLVSHVSEKTSVAWFQELLTLGESKLFINFNIDALKRLLKWEHDSSLILLIWFHEKYPEKFGLFLDTDTILSLLENSSSDPHTPLKEKKIDLLVKGQNWKKRVVRKDREATLRSHAFCFSHESLVATLSKAGEWEWQELKEILSLKNRIDRHQCQKLIALFLQAEPRLERDDLDNFVWVILKGQQELKCLEPILARQPELSSYFSSHSYSDFFNYNPSPTNLEWLFEQGVKRPDREDAEHSLLRGSVPSSLRTWWLQSIAQGITLSSDKKQLTKTQLRNCGGKEALEPILKETWERVLSDKRFKKNGTKSKISRFFACDSQSYRVKHSGHAHYLEIYRLRGDTDILFRVGIYTFDRLVEILQEDARFINLKMQDLRPHFSDLPVSIVPIGTAHDSTTTPVWLEQDDVGIIAFYYGDGDLKSQIFYWSTSCVERARAFIVEHTRQIQEKFNALQALANSNPPWKCLSETGDDPGLGKFIVVGKKGEATYLKIAYKKKGNIFSNSLKFETILSPEKAKAEMDKLTAYQECHCDGLDLFGSVEYHLNEFTFHEMIALCMDSPGLVILNGANTDILVTKDFVSNRCFLMPSSWSQNREKAHSLHLAREMLTGYALNRNLTKTLQWQPQVELTHEGPAPVDLFHLVNFLEQIKNSPSLKAYLARQSYSFESMKATLERFLKALQNRTIQGFVPFDKYEKEYRKLEIQLTQIQLALIDKPEELSQFVRELGYYSQFCGPRIAETVQFIYRTTFNLLQVGETLQEGSTLQLLKKAYERAALETLETFLNWIQDERDKRQTTHVLSYLRKTLTDAQYSLPPDSRMASQDRWEGAYGTQDFPRADLPHLFEGMLLPHLIEVLSAMQQEARQAKDNDLGALLISSIRDCVAAFSHLPEIADLSVKRALIESQKEADLEQERRVKGAFETKKAELLQGRHVEWQNYQKAVQTIAASEAKIDSCSDRLLELQRAYEAAAVDPFEEIGKKRKFIRLIASENEFLPDQEVQAERLKQIGDEIKALHHQRENLQRELQFLRTLLERAKRGHLKEIFDMEEEIQKSNGKISEIIVKASRKIVEQIEEACTILGWLEEDEFCVPSVSRRGLCILLQQHQYLIPGGELKRQRELQRLQRLQRQMTHYPVLQRQNPRPPPPPPPPAPPPQVVDIDQFIDDILM